MNHPVVIIGSGLAGYAVARELRKLDAEQPILLLSADHGGFYSKPMLSNALTTGKTPESIINGDADKMASQLNISIRPYKRVIAIDKTRRTITLENNEQLFTTNLFWPWVPIKCGYLYEEVVHRRYLRLMMLTITSSSVMPW